MLDGRTAPWIDGGSAPSCSPIAAARRDLEAIVHPAVYRAIAAGLRAFELTDDPPLAVVDIPLLYETGRQRDFDRVIATRLPARRCSSRG